MCQTWVTPWPGRMGSALLPDGVTTPRRPVDTPHPSKGGRHLPDPLQWAWWGAGTPPRPCLGAQGNRSPYSSLVCGTPEWSKVPATSPMPGPLGIALILPPPRPLPHGLDPATHTHGSLRVCNPSGGGAGCRGSVCLSGGMGQCPPGVSGGSSAHRLTCLRKTPRARLRLGSSSAAWEGGEARSGQGPRGELGRDGGDGRGSHRGRRTLPRGGPSGLSEEQPEARQVQRRRGGPRNPDRAAAAHPRRGHRLPVQCPQPPALRGRRRGGQRRGGRRRRRRGTARGAHGRDGTEHRPPRGSDGSARPGPAPVRAGGGGERRGRGADAGSQPRVPDPVPSSGPRHPAGAAPGEGKPRCRRLPRGGPRDPPSPRCCQRDCGDRQLPGPARP